MTSHSDVDLRVLREEYLTALEDSYGLEELQEKMRQTLAADATAEVDKQLKDRYNEFMREKVAITQPEPRSGLPGAGELNLPSDKAGLEAQQCVAYVSHSEDSAPVVEELTHAMALPIEEEHVDEASGTLAVTATWSVPADLAPLNAVTPDKRRGLARVRIVVDVEGSPNPLVLDKVLAFKVHNRKVSFKPSGWERLKESSMRHCPRGCGIAVQIINGYPELRGHDGVCLCLCLCVCLCVCVSVCVPVCLSVCIFFWGGEA